MSNSSDATLTEWLETTVEEGPLQLRTLAGGNSNETLLVDGRSARYVLRRPPAAALDASAHSMAREFQMLSALAEIDFPAPRPIALRKDPPALLMSHLDGVSLTDELPATYSPDAVAEVGFAAVEALAELHSLPWKEIGLDDFGRPANFLGRQVKRWRSQYERVRHRDLPAFEQVASWLERNTPEEGEPGILHGDFHIDNCLFGREAPVLLGVIDWEMATIGDPLLDLGLLLAFWGSERPATMAMPRIQAFSRAAGAPTRAALAARYEERSGRSVERLDYYLTLAFWKLAAIVEGAHLQYLEGRLRSDYARALGEDVPALLEQARESAALGTG